VELIDRRTVEASSVGFPRPDVIAMPINGASGPHSAHSEPYGQDSSLSRLGPYFKAALDRPRGATFINLQPRDGPRTVEKKIDAPR
jgi:hypothetical protein